MLPVSGKSVTRRKGTPFSTSNLWAQSVPPSQIVTVLRQVAQLSLAERPRCKLGQFWPKVEDDILQAI